MKALRAFSLIWLVLVLASASVTMAVARHQARAIGEVVLCTGYGLVSVSIDADGNPTGPLMPCPDSTPALAALTDVSVPVVRTPGELVPVRYQSRDFPAPRVPALLHHNSRAPPVLV